jgi:hypothetical protein
MDEFDFFAKVEVPKLYICDIILMHTVVVRGKRTTTNLIEVKNQPLTLLDGKMPTENYKKRILRKMFNTHISKGDFSKEYPNMDIKVKNSVFSSNLSYKFDFKKH